MTIKEVLQEVWNNWVKDPSERKRYSIQNRDYSPLNVTKEEFWGRDVPADWEHFGVCVLTKTGYFTTIEGEELMWGYPWNECVDFKFEDLGIIAYDDLGNPQPLSLNLIDSDKWEMIERGEKQ